MDIHALGRPDIPQCCKPGEKIGLAKKSKNQKFASTVTDSFMTRMCAFFVFLLFCCFFLFFSGGLQQMASLWYVRAGQSMQGPIG
jgi:hypothetical protein